VSNTTDRAALFEAIRSAPGAAYIDRSHSRSFSLNIFQRNAQELIEATQNVRDPDQGLQLMAVANREAGQQAHREINRLVHNFVAGSMSLIEHTRQFIREHYADTCLKGAYEDRVKADFASEPVAKFVQDLRNYMVHKGLPSSQMFLAFERIADGPGGELTTGVRYETRVLLEWDGWTAPAKAYIEAAGEHIDIHVFAESYLEKVLQFHAWLDTELQQYHAADVAQLQSMQEDFARLSGQSSAPEPSSAPTGAQSSAPEPSSAPTGAESASPPPDESPVVMPFEFPFALAAVIDETGKTILDKIRRLDFADPTANSFPSERPISATLTPDTIRETPILRGNDSEGRPVVAFLTSGAEVFGLDANFYAELRLLADKILELSWAKQALSRKFIEETALHWFRSSFRATTQQVSFSGALSSASRNMVRPLDLWAPIAYLEVEAPFEFGSVKIAPITTAMIGELEVRGLSSSPNQRDDVAVLFKDLRSRMQGFAAVVVHAEAEPNRAHEDGMAIAQNVVGLLRFFSPVARVSRRSSSTALLGAEALPRSQALVVGQDYFSFSDGLVSPPFLWRLSKENVSALWETGLAKASSLISPGGLSEFSLAVRASLLLYSTGTTLHNSPDRLVYALSSVEGILLKHSMEPTEFNVEERMSLLLANDKLGREEVARNVREAYRIRKRHGAAVLTPRDENSLAIFARNAHITLCIALENLQSFARKADFIEAIDSRKTAAAVQ